jgi:voltage-gated potassium channel
MESPAKRIGKAFAIVIIAITFGTVGFMFLSEKPVTLFDCFYMTIITLSTVGYGEVIELTDWGRAFASVLILTGMGSLIYFASTIVAFWIEIDLKQIRLRKRMQKKIDRLNKHLIVCGAGTTGGRVLDELLDTKTPFVVVDINEDVLHAFAASKKRHRFFDNFLYVKGDATEDAVLFNAGIERASGLVAALRNDKDNLYLILSARQLNPGMRIVARATERDAVLKMERAGADKVVALNLLGGMRIASEMIRPDVTEFLDLMLKDKAQNHRIEQVNLPDDSPLAGRKLSDSKIRKAADVLVIAIKNRDGKFLYNPGSDTVLKKNSTLVILGAIDDIIKFRKSLNGEIVSPSIIPPPPAD